ncbi:MAG: hypothetical protein RO009_02680 [Pseudorhodoplanes sp.]|nr:hypothetical protein [Pseudorhodoplanes sp.]
MVEPAHDELKIASVMARRTPVYIVCSPRPRTGKTLLARVLTDFQLVNNRQPIAYDLNRNENLLATLLPHHTAIADLSDTRGQMALFDGLIAGGDVPRIIDLGAEAFDPFFTVARQIGFMREAQRRGIDPMLLFIADPHPRSAQFYGYLHQAFPHTVIVPVQNEANISARGYMEPFRPVTTERGLFIPRLNPVIKGVIDKPHFSFASFMRKPADLRTELHVWTEKVFIEFRELELRVMLRELKSALPFR